MTKDEILNLQQGEAVIHKTFGECIVEQPASYNHKVKRMGIALSPVNEKDKLRLAAETGVKWNRIFEIDFEYIRAK
jgi:hypothetical protein